MVTKFVVAILQQAALTIGLIALVAALVAVAIYRLSKSGQRHIR